jgi:hypothetical protein
MPDPHTTPEPSSEEVQNLKYAYAAFWNFPAQAQIDYLNKAMVAYQKRWMETRIINAN